jgi:hypothetical protein
MAEHLQARSCVPQPVADASSAPVPVIEDAGDPREGLKSALDDLAQAEMLRDDAREVVDRAMQRVAKAEEDIAQFDDLDAKVAAWEIGQVRSNRVADMPYALIAASRERAAECTVAMST